MKSPIVFAICLLAVPASISLAADTTSGNAASPKTACDQIVAAAKKDDFKTVESLTANWGMPHHGAGETAGMNPKKMESDVKSAHQHHLSQLKDLSCGDEHVAGDHAVVEASSQGQKRLIPFVQVNGQWKFDARTYMSFYHRAMHEHGHEASQEKSAARSG